MLAAFLNDRAHLLDMSVKPATLALAAGAVLVIAALAYRGSSPEGGSAVDGGAPGASSQQAVEASASGRTTRPPSERSGAVMVEDAMGGRLDAARLFELGFAGGLVIDEDTRSAIEAVLNSLPQDPSDEDLKRLENTLRAGLPREEAERAMKLFTDYRAYNHDIVAQMQPQGIPGNLQELNAFFDQMESLKRRHFDEATAKALFGEHDAWARITMEASIVEMDASLTPEQKKARIDALRQKLPPDQRQRIPVGGEGASQASS